MSVDTVIIEFSVEKQFTQVKLKRHLAPSTVATLKKMLSTKDITTRAIIRGTEIQFPIRIGRVGREKAINKVEQGSVVYSPQSGIISVFLSNGEPYSPVNLLGNIDTAEFFKKLQQGAAIKLRLILRDEEIEK